MKNKNLFLFLTPVFCFLISVFCPLTSVFAASLQITQAIVSPSAISPNEDEINDEAIISSTVAVSGFEPAVNLILVVKTRISDPYGNVVKELRRRLFVQNDTQVTVNQTWDGRKRNHTPAVNGLYAYQVTARIRRIISPPAAGEIIVVDSPGLASRSLITILSPGYGSYIKGDIPVEVAYRNGVKAVELYLDNQLVGEVSFNPPYKKGTHTFIIDSQSYPDGEHAIQAFAYLTNAGRGTKRKFKYHYSPEVSVTIDNTAPSIAELTPQPDTSVNETKPLISAVLDDETGEIDAASLSMRLDDSTVAFQYYEDTGLIAFQPDTDLTNGTHTVEISAQDLAGNETTVSWQFNVTTEVILSVSVSPDTWNLGAREPGAVITMSAAEKITVLNDGNIPATYSLQLVNPGGWQASAAQTGPNTYILNAGFASDISAISWNEANHALSINNVPCSGTQFAGDQTGTEVPTGENRTLWLQFKAPESTSIGNEQMINVIVTAQLP